MECRTAFARVCVAFSVVVTLGCKDSSLSATSAGALGEICTELSASYVIPGDPPSHGQINRRKNLAKLVSEGEPPRMEGARKLLAHSECHPPAILEAAIRASGETGDPRVVADLAEMVTQRGYTGDPCKHSEDEEPGSGNGNGNGNGKGNGHQEHGEGHGYGHDHHDHDSEPGDEEEPTGPSVPGEIAYTLSTRVAAAAALGRIVERDRTIDLLWAQEGLTAEQKASALHALQLAGCPPEHPDLRGAALEAIGITRLWAGRHYLEVAAVDPSLPDDEVRSLLFIGLANRSLTNIMANQHVDESQTAEIRDVIRAFNEAAAGGVQ